MTSFPEFVELNKNTGDLIAIAIGLSKIGARVPVGLFRLIDKQGEMQDKILREWRGEEDTK